MSSFTQTIRKTLSGSLRALSDYPITILSAALFVIVTMIRIQIGWPQLESYAFLLNCLNLSLALGTTFSLMAITFAHSRFNTKKAFLLANVLSLLVVVFSFFMLFLFSGTYSASAELPDRVYNLLSPLAIARVSMAMLVSYLLFIVFSGQPANEKSSVYRPEETITSVEPEPVKIISGEDASDQEDVVLAQSGVDAAVVSKQLGEVPGAALAEHGVDAAVLSAEPGNAAESKLDDITSKKGFGIFDIDFAGAFFMHQKAFFIASIYGLVLLLGTSGVAGAIQALLYQDMSFKVYQHLATIVGFISFTVFVGFFPDFRKGTKDEQQAAAQAQPRFVEVLFEYIMIPLMISLSVVLLLWTARTVIFGLKVPFVELAGIAAAYALAGFWLHMMVSEYKSKLAKFFLNFYPFAALLILVPYAMALWKQLNNTGLKLTEYWFILIWLIAAVGAILLLIRRARAYLWLVAIICVLAIFSVLPFVGYNVLPVKAQTSRLEALLTAEDMLKEDAIIAAAEEPDLEVRAAITDAVYYLINANDAKLPIWLDKGLNDGQNFENVFGFAQVWSLDEGVSPGISTGISLYLADIAIKIDEYSLAIPVRPGYDREQYYIAAEGSKGSYRIYWTDFGTTLPELEIWKDEELILEQDMSDYIDGLMAKYPLNDLVPATSGLEEMTMVLETAEIKTLLVFRSVEIIAEPQSSVIYYAVNLETIYMREK